VSFWQYRRSKLFQLLNYAIPTADVEVPPQRPTIFGKFFFLGHIISTLLDDQSQGMSGGDNYNFASDSVKNSFPDTRVLFDHGDNKTI
jgi:hypothetical protein